MFISFFGLFISSQTPIDTMLSFLNLSPTFFILPIQFTHRSSIKVLQNRQETSCSSQTRQQQGNQVFPSGTPSSCLTDILCGMYLTTRLNHIRTLCVLTITPILFKELKCYLGFDYKFSTDTSHHIKHDGGCVQFSFLLATRVMGIRKNENRLLLLTNKVTQLRNTKMQ